MRDRRKVVRVRGRANDTAIPLLSYNEVESVATDMGRNINMVFKTRVLEQLEEFNCIWVISGINMNVEATGDKERISTKENRFQELGEFSKEYTRRNRVVIGVWRCK